MSEVTGIRQGVGPGVVGEPFTVGRAFGGAFTVFSQALPQFLALTSIAHVPLLLFTLLGIAYPSVAVYGVAIATFLAMIVGSLSAAMCLFGAYQVMRGRPFSVGESLSVALARFWPVIGTSLLRSLYVFLLSLLLVVPGIIYACSVFVALPSCVIERLGPNASLRRSRDLTKGYRWSIFGLWLALVVVTSLLIFGANYLALLTIGRVGAAFAQFIAQVLLGGFGAVLAAVVYRDLRAAKEGVDVETLASVFD